ncbi:MAG: SRPBCC domain-containing protein, partial [Anaerolineae bacterium]|nr:SRPBCC domain-containing protein [Anaerolineae bacterium]
SPMRGHIQHETQIDASPQRVWDVLTNPDELNRWIATQANIHLEKDGVYGLGWTSGDTDYGASKILVVVPGEKLVLEIGAFTGQSPTMVTWEMKENNGKTWLTFTHSGFDADQDVSELHSGWLNFVNWMRSVSEYGASWVAPVPALSEGAIGYPATVFSGQNQLAPELREKA